MPHRIYTHDCLWREVRINVTAAVLTIEIRSRDSPFTRIRLASDDICWNGISRKEVNSDKGAGPCHSKHASPLSVERRTVAPNGSFHTAADGIIKLAIKVIIIGYTRLSVG